MFVWAHERRSTMAPGRQEKTESSVCAMLVSSAAALPVKRNTTKRSGPNLPVSKAPLSPAATRATVRQEDYEWATQVARERDRSHPKPDNGGPHYRVQPGRNADTRRRPAFDAPYRLPPCKSEAHHGGPARRRRGCDRRCKRVHQRRRGLPRTSRRVLPQSLDVAEARRQARDGGRNGVRGEPGKPQQEARAWRRYRVEGADRPCDNVARGGGPLDRHVRTAMAQVSDDVHAVVGHVERDVSSNWGRFSDPQDRRSLRMADENPRPVRAQRPHAPLVTVEARSPPAAGASECSAVADGLIWVLDRLDVERRLDLQRHDLDLPAWIGAGRFREDLYHCLAVITLAYSLRARERGRQGSLACHVEGSQQHALESTVDGEIGRDRSEERRV